MKRVVVVSIVKDATSTATRDTSAEVIIKQIRNGKWHHPMQTIRSKFQCVLAETKGDRKAAKEAIAADKKKLPGILWSGQFSRRANDALIEHSGLICADLDVLGSRLSEVRKKLLTSSYLLALFRSPTGNGLKAIFCVPNDAAKHLASFRSVQRHVMELTGVQIDEACKDVVRLCFVSSDLGLYYNPNALELVPPVESEKPKVTAQHNEHNYKPDKAMVCEMLAVIPKRPDYPDWLKIVSAVGDALPTEDAIEVLREWSPEEKPQEYADKLRHRLKNVTVATLIYVACEYGWKNFGGVTGKTEVWGEPRQLPEDLPAVPQFNLACLPDTFRPWAEDVAERMQCPPDFPAVGAIVALGSLVGRKIGIRPKRQDDWLVIPNLWGCVIGRPGLMKTPALEQALLPLRCLVAEALERYEEAMHEHGISVMLKTQRKKLTESKIGQHLKDGNEGAARDEAKAVASAGDDEPVLRRYEVNDSTVAKLGEILAQNPNGLLIHRDELVGFLRGLDKEGNEEARAFFLESWNGTGSFTFDRIGRGTVRVESNTLSVIGGIQPDLLTAYVREAVRGGAGADGLLQRFQLAVWPDVSKQWRNVDRRPDTKSKDETFSVFKYLDALTAEAVGADASSGIPFLRFASNAQDCFDLWRAELETKLRSDTEHPAFEAHLSKYRKLVPALALLIHLANRDIGRVSLAALEKALIWTNYLEAHARRIYSAVLRPDMTAARELAKRLARGDLPTRFTLRETYRKGWTGLNSKEEAEAATEILCDFGWVRAVSETGRTLGRPASTAFEINPKVRRTPSCRLTKLTKPVSVSSVSLGEAVSGLDDLLAEQPFPPPGELVEELV
jgi:hypothetical protein